MEIDKIYNADCLSNLAGIADKKVDLVVSDPPYIVAYKTNARKGEHKFKHEIVNDRNEQFIYDYLNECYRILKDDTAAYVFCSSKTIPLFVDAAKKAGFVIKNIIIWKKNAFTMGDLEAQYGQQYEPVLYLNKGRRSINGKRMGDVWECRRVVGDNQLHQNQKPIDLLMQMIEKSSEKGDLVFDGCMGSASTAIAALRMHRHFIGYEIDDEYFKIAKRRVDVELQSPTLDFI